MGVHHPIDTANDFVIGPLKTLPDQPALACGSRPRTPSASPAQQASWTAAYEKAVANASFARGALKVPPGAYGPVGTMIGSLTSMARSGALDGALLSSRQFYGTDYTKPLLFIADGTYLANLAQSQHLSGDQWGMMNETGNYPGQAWLWLYTLWYQVPPMKTSANADLQVWAIMMVLTAGVGPVALHPGSAVDSSLEPGLPSDLAAALSGARQGRRRPGTAAHRPRCAGGAGRGLGRSSPNRRRTR